MIDRLRRAVRLEDLLLIAWVVFVAPLLVPSGDEAPAFAPNPIEGVFGLVGLVGLAICVGARAAPGVTTGLTIETFPFLFGPLIGALALVVADSMNDLGVLGFGPLVVVGLIVLGIVARLRLPPLEAIARRALVTPFVLASGGSFAEFLVGFGDLFDLGGAIRDAEASGLDLGATLLLFGLALLGVLVFYAMLVFAPRQVAEREGTPGRWAIRFALFAVSLVAGSTWVGLLRG